MLHANPFLWDPPPHAGGGASSIPPLHTLYGTNRATGNPSSLISLIWRGDHCLSSRFPAGGGHDTSFDLASIKQKIRDGAGATPVSAPAAQQESRWVPAAPNLSCKTRAGLLPGFAEAEGSILLSRERAENNTVGKRLLGNPTQEQHKCGSCLWPSVVRAARGNAAGSQNLSPLQYVFQHTDQTLHFSKAPLTQDRVKMSIWGSAPLVFHRWFFPPIHFMPPGQNERKEPPKQKQTASKPDVLKTPSKPKYLHKTDTLTAAKAHLTKFCRWWKRPKQLQKRGTAMPDAFAR